MTTTTAPAARDFAAEYLAACRDARRADATLAESGVARNAARKIARAADRADVRIDEIALDEQARVELHG